MSEINCNCCKQLLPCSSFYSRKNGKPILPCKQCKIKIAQERFRQAQQDLEWKENLKQQNRKSYLKNKEKILEKQKKYYVSNKEKYKSFHKNYEKLYPRKNRKRNPGKISTETKLRRSVAGSIAKHIKKYGGRKDQSSVRYLDYSYGELKLHLESLFESWMSWQNYGKYDPKSWNDDDLSTWKWQIDHIVPHANFSYSSMEEEDFQKCWGLENLRPYSAKQNILDGANKTRHKGIKNE